MTSLQKRKSIKTKLKHKWQYKITLPNSQAYNHFYYALTWRKKILKKMISSYLVYKEKYGKKKTIIIKTNLNLFIYKLFNLLKV